MFGRIVGAALVFVTAIVSPAVSQDATDGRAIFATTCAGCHGLAGEGGYGPPLTANEFVAVSADLVIRILTGGELMPPLRHLSDAEIAAIVNFVRTELNELTDQIDTGFVADRRE